MSDKCLVKDCPNHKGEGRFIGDLCGPCHRMLSTGSIGHGQTFIHQMRDSMARVATTVEREVQDLARSVPPGAEQVLCSEYLHCENANVCLHAKWHGASGRGHGFGSENDRAVGCGNKQARCQ
jgi:hypothetical protein